ncbi:hypothetical protein QUC31_009082 [Theobroma cacao]|nr:PREDICTED: uncharacterized protein LOC18606717 [Theobroma cacao]WRX17703.1 hypothetical protein QQP08_010190 [Theobroma cacao]
MSKRRELNPDQRRAKNEGDRRRRRDHKMEFQRLQMAEAQLEPLRNENRHLREEIERLNAMLSNLMNTIHQLRDEIRQQRETEEMVDSWIQSPNEDGASNEPITRGH